MADNDRPLPNPQRTRFGRPIPGQEGSAGPLTADRMAQAAAEGRLDEFLQQEIPEGGHARDLAMMMLGMSGMMPPQAPGARPEATAGAPAASPGVSAPTPPGMSLTSDASVPPEVIAAAAQGDVAGLVSLLRAEHERRGGGLSQDAGTPPVSPLLQAGVDAGPAGGQAAIDSAIVEELLRIAADNRVGVDWLVLRAVKLYVEDHRKTGRL